MYIRMFCSYGVVRSFEDEAEAFHFHLMVESNYLHSAENACQARKLFPTKVQQLLLCFETRKKFEGVSGGGGEGSNFFPRGLIQLKKNVFFHTLRTMPKNAASP